MNSQNIFFDLKELCFLRWQEVNNPMYGGNVYYKIFDAINADGKRLKLVVCISFDIGNILKRVAGDFDRKFSEVLNVILNSLIWNKCDKKYSWNIDVNNKERIIVTLDSSHFFVDRSIYNHSDLVTLPLIAIYKEFRRGYYEIVNLPDTKNQGNLLCLQA